MKKPGDGRAKVSEQKKRQMMEEREARMDAARLDEIKRTIAEGHLTYAVKLAQRYNMTHVLTAEQLALGTPTPPDLTQELDASAVLVSKSGKDGPTVEFKQKHDLRQANFKKSASRAKRNVDSTVWDSYYYNDLLTWRQHRAAEIYWEAWYCGGMDAKVTGSYEDAGGGGTPGQGTPFSLYQLQHRDILAGLNRRLGVRLSALVVHVICMNEPANRFGLSIGKSKRQSDAGMELFREALDMIADEMNLRDKSPKGSDELDEPEE